MRCSRRICDKVPPKRDTFSCELRLRDATPVQLWSRRNPARVAPLPDGHGGPSRARPAGARDPSPARRREGRPVASHAKDQFIASLSHELRTPLTPVLAAVTALRGRADVPEHLRGLCEMIRRNVLTEARLIDDLLDVTRITQGKMRIERQPTDVHETIREAVELLESEVRAKHLSLSLSLDAEDHGAAADAVRLKQVFWNLLSNAVRFTPDGGAIEVRSWNGSSNGHRLLRVEVSDNGPGFDPALASEIVRAVRTGRYAGAERRVGSRPRDLPGCDGVAWRERGRQQPRARQGRAVRGRD